MTDLEWKIINNYQVSNTGRVIGKSGKELKPAINQQGYYQVAFHINGVQYNKRVNRLVAECFIPNPENKPEVNHKDGDKRNNHVDNLEWCTKSENQLHAFRNGFKSMPRGNDSPCVKISDEDILKIREMKGVLKYKEIAEIYNVDASLISRIQNNQRRC